MLIMDLLAFRDFIIISENIEEIRAWICICISTFFIDITKHPMVIYKHPLTFTNVMKLYIYFFVLGLYCHSEVN